jgi:NADH-quinone oxidoreductase subunit L
VALIADYVWLIPAVPIILSSVPMFAGRRLPMAGGFVAILSVAASTVISLSLLASPPSAPVDMHITWILPGQGTPITVGFYVDNLSILMSAITSSIALLILIYSVEYMRHEEGLPRYWAEMMLFTGSMLGFALSDSIILMYVFWELIGVCSYLLIGFWYTRPEVASAAKKAFVIVRVGDVGFLIGFILLYFYGHTLSLANIINAPLSVITSPQLRTLIAILIFTGAIGKSAQLPLFTWLPDAMEGPTTVSALIHSATMVAAGVYLVARLYPFFYVSPYALEVVALIGALSAFVAATMALVSYDLKRILAYSTMSQLGYMMVGLGVGAYGAAMFHLLNHAVFKAMLFLSAGAVLHVLDTRDIRQMGGLFRHMKITGLAFLVGALALSGIFPFNGFFSKDLIIGASYEYGLSTGDYWVYLLTLSGALLTAVYIFRAFFVAFILPPRVKIEKTVREVPLVMTVPMVVLIALTLATGWLWSPLTNIFQPYIRYAASIPNTVEAPIEFTLITLTAAFAGIALSFLAYIRGTIDPAKITRNLMGSKLYTLIVKSYYFDEAYDAVARGMENGVGYLLDAFDRRIVDGIVNGIGVGLVGFGKRLRAIETGNVRNYVAAMILGIVLIILLLEVL